MSRELSDSICLPGQEILVTISLQFDSLSSDAKGVYIAENIPTLLFNSLQTLSLELDEVDITDSVIVEYERSNSVYDGAITVRWILETPSNFNENLPVISNQNLIVRYTVTIPADATENTEYGFPNTSWIAVIDPSGAPSYEFGHADFSDPSMMLSVTPVELTSFAATRIKEGVILLWETATEVNNYGFDIERSVDGRNWNKLWFVEGHGNSNSPKSYSFVDNELISTKILYRLKQIDTDGSFEYSDVVEVLVDGQTEFKLVQNFPNPFNPSTVIRYSLPEASEVNLSVFNSLGQEVVNLINERQEAGRFNITFNASNLPSGIYYYSIRANNYYSVKKMLLLK